MNRTIAAALLPVVFAFASLTGCAADSISTDDSSPSHEATAPTSPAAAISGSAGTSAMASSGSADGHAYAAVGKFPARLVVTEAGSTTPIYYDVLAYDFGLDTDQSGIPGLARSGVDPGKAQLRPLGITVKANAKSQLLAQSITGAVRLGTVVLQRYGANGKLVELASFEKARVTKMSSAALGDERDTYELAVGAMTVTQGAARVTVDVTTNTSECADPCPCMAPGAGLGPYTQAPSATWGIPAGNTRVDQISVDLHNDVAVPGTGAIGGAGKLVIDGIAFEAPLETGGACAMYASALGSHVEDLHLGVAAQPATKSAKAVETTVWDACFAFVSSVGISSGDDGSPHEHVALKAGGVVRTDRNVDVNGVPTGPATTNGWSMLRNQPISTCAAALPPSDELP